MFWYTLFLIVATGRLTGGVSHSFRIFITAVSGTSEFPEFAALGYVDDELFGKGKLTSQSIEPCNKWVVDAVGEDCWDRSLKTLQVTRQTSGRVLKIVMDRNNQTSGIHSVQMMYGCSLNHGTTSGFYLIGYDGMDYIIFDKETQTWTAVAPTAGILINEWNSDKPFTMKWKGYLEQECTEWLQKYLMNAQSSLGRKAPPEAKMTDKTESGNTKLKCRVSGFYPQAIDVYFVKGDNHRIESTTSSGVLPNNDGTYYTEKWIEIDPQDKYHHSCHIKHESLNSNLIVKLDQTSSVALIAGIIAVVAMILTAVIAVVIWKKVQKGGKQYIPANSGKQYPPAFSGKQYPPAFISENRI